MARWMRSGTFVGPGICRKWRPDGWESSGPNAALIAGTAVGVGLATAFLRKKDRWEPVATLPPVTPVVGARDGRAVLGLRVGF